MMKMREFMRITLVCVCAFLLAVRETRCEDEVSEVEEGGALRGEDQNEQRKDSKGPIPGKRTYITSHQNINKWPCVTYVDIINAITEVTVVNLCKECVEWRVEAVQLFVELETAKHWSRI